MKCYVEKLKAESKKLKEKFPIFIPSYNRPNAQDLISGCLSEDNFNDKDGYKIYIVVRDSQREQYENGIKSKNKYVDIISFPDEEIDSAGKARNKIVSYCYGHKIKYFFMFDDDITKLCYSTIDEETGKTKVIDSTVDTLDMWTYLMLESEKYNVAISGVYDAVFAYTDRHSDEKEMINLNNHKIVIASCINSNLLIENNINYRNSREVGPEDVDLIVQIFRTNKLNIASYHCLSVATRPPASDTFTDFDTAEERNQKYSEMIVNNNSDLDWLILKNYKDKYKYVVISYPRYRNKRGQKDASTYKISFSKLMKDKENLNV